ncbi:MAG: hypothetical protein HZA90_22365 [Verrucomicrobia bacterium]|nr:hypothetical protein [Verrucomicrobiota bacterium]
MNKFFELLFKNDGGLLEQLLSPLVVHTAPEHAESKAICSPHSPFGATLPQPMGEGNAPRPQAKAPAAREVRWEWTS